MARELPIHNGRMTTDLDANGFKINNLPPGSGFTQVQSDWSQADSTAPDFIKNKPKIPVLPTLATVATSGSYDDLTDKPTIPAPVSVDHTLTTQGAAADAKAVGDALRGGFTEWECVPATYSGKTLHVERENGEWNLYADDQFLDPPSFAPGDATNLTFSVYGVTATRHAFPPTKTSQLTNDGDGTNAFVKTNDTRLSDARTPTAHTHAIADVTGLGTALAQKADAADLPYRLVEPGKWEFSGSGYDPTKTYYVGPVGTGDAYYYELDIDGVYADESATRPSDDALVVEFNNAQITATRASLPGHLCDRANNLIDATSGNVTLTLPEYQAGKLRDLLVYVDLGDDGTDPYSITFNFPSGESNTGFKVEGNDPTSATFPAPTAAGEWWYSFTECKPHKFSVSLKQLQDAPQAQGGA